MKNNYEQKNAHRVISQLATMTNTLNKMIIAFSVLTLGSLVTILSMLFARDYWWLGGIIGIIVGFGFGIYLASVLNLIIEWMVQVLIAQGEVLENQKSPRENLEATISQNPAE